MTVDLSKKKEELHREIAHLSLPQCLVMMGVLLERSMILSNMQKKTIAPQSVIEMPK